jgi:hypothetical protein
MATAPVGIAPVLTPYTLGALADTCEQDHLPEQALFLRRLLPFVEDIVQKCFVPLLSQPREGSFFGRFDKLSKDFEPFRLYLNTRLFSIFVTKEDVLSFYEQVLLDLLNPLVKTAREMDMGPELISAIVRDYIKIVRALFQAAGGTTIQNDELTVEQLTKLVDWFHAATRFDYALTSVFLVLEKSIPAPAANDKSALLSACKQALFDFGQTMSRMVAHESLSRALSDLETPHIKIKVERNGIQPGATPPVGQARTELGLDPSHRQMEMSWLARHKDLADFYGGQWIVLEKDELVANDMDYEKARHIATQKGIKRPFIIFLSFKENGAFMGI